MSKRGWGGRNGLAGKKWPKVVFLAEVALVARWTQWLWQPEVSGSPKWLEMASEALKMAMLARTGNGGQKWMSMT